ncbi:MAG: DUF3298 and DUF4163 domain-containing protein [Syntrophomonadaceae bacterium]|jgi:hypothetical protein
MKKAVGYLLIAVMLLLPAGMASAQNAVFIDTEGQWAQKDIEAAYTQGLMQGTGINESGSRVFSPEENVDRFQLAAILQRAFDLDYGNMRFVKQPAASDYYYDLDEQAWYSEAVALGAINHIFAWQDEFKGEEAVSRIEVARSIYRAFQAKGINVPMIMLMPMYNDTAKLSQEDVNAMVFVSNTGIMKGNDNLFWPYDPIKRAELARVFNQCAELIKMNPVEVNPANSVKLDIKEVKSESPLINIDLNIPVISGLGNEQIQTKLNQLLANEAAEREEAMQKQAQADSDFIMTEPYHTYELVSRFNQYYVSGHILSFYVDYYTFTGGAHGMTERKAHTFDLNTGEELELNDLFSPDFNYTEMINERVQDAINQNPDIYFEGENGFQGINEDQGFYLENGSLIVYFLQYEIAPYAAGIRTFSIPLQFKHQNQDNENQTAVIRQGPGSQYSYSAE